MNRIKELRTRAKCTQKELADLLGVTSMTISRWEKEENPAIKHEQAQTLANHFKVSVPYLLGYSEKIPVEEQSSLYKNGVTDIEAVEPIYFITEAIGIENKDKLLDFLRKEFNLEYNEFKDDIDEPYEKFIDRTINRAVSSLWDVPKSLNDLIAYWSMLSDNQRTILLSIIKDLIKLNNL